jgi:hypothetical protein
MKEKKFKNVLISIAIAGSLCAFTTASANDIVETNWSGVFTLLDSTGGVVINSSETTNRWLGERTDITGTLKLDVYTGGITGTVAPFYFSGSQVSLSGLNVQAIGNGLGQPGGLVLGNMLFTWGGSSVPISIVWNADGFFSLLSNNLYPGITISNVGATPASDGIAQGGYPIGPAPIATTTWNTTTVCAPQSSGPFVGNNINIDVTSMTVTSAAPLFESINASVPTNCAVSGGYMPSGGFPLIADTIGGSPIPAAVPVPAAIWLLGSSALGLLGFMRRNTRQKLNKNGYR